MSGGSGGGGGGGGGGGRGRARAEAAVELTASPYDLLGGAENVLALAESFYDAMEELEPALTALHACDAPGKVSRGSRDRFGLFLVGWLGGPQDYIARHGHPRLRMRHAHVPIDRAMRDAWLRAMQAGMDRRNLGGEVRACLDVRFAEVADFLRNQPEQDDPGS